MLPQLMAHLNQLQLHYGPFHHRQSHNLPTDTCSCRRKTGESRCHICGPNNNYNEMRYIMCQNKSINIRTISNSKTLATTAPVFYHSKSTNNDFIILSVININVYKSGVYKQNISNYNDAPVKIASYPQQKQVIVHSLVVNPDNGDLYIFFNKYAFAIFNLESNQWKKECSFVRSNLCFISQWIPFPYNEMHFLSSSMTTNALCKYCIGSTRSGKTKKYEITTQNDMSHLTPSSCIMIYENGSRKLLLIDMYKTGQIWEYHHEQCVWMLLDISLPTRGPQKTQQRNERIDFMKTIIGFNNVLIYFDGDVIWCLDLLFTKKWYKAQNTFNNKRYLYYKRYISRYDKRYRYYDASTSPYRYWIKGSSDKMYFLSKDLQMIEFSLLDIWPDELCSNILPKCRELVDGYTRQQNGKVHQFCTDLLCLILEFWGPPSSKSEAISFYAGL